MEKKNKRTNFIEFFKRNLKTILAIIITAILVSGTTAFATYNYYAKDISYLKKDGTKTNVADALNDIYDKLGKKYDLSKLELLWAPVGSQTNYYSGTYTCNPEYTCLIVVYYSNISDNTAYVANNLKEIYHTDSFGRYYEEVQFYVYTDITDKSTIYFSISNLDRAGIGVLGLK